MKEAKRRMVTVDGNEAAAAVAYEFTEIAAIYPITPSSPMATKTDMWSAAGRKNMFGQTVHLVEMQSEAGAIGAVHGSLQAGALTSTYTSSQGLMLMIPTMYRIAGEHLPAVMHVAARTVGTHGMSIFGDHSDVMACRDTGWAEFCSSSVQEAADLAAVAHLAAIQSRVPFIHFFDGFRTSHELSRIEMPDVKALSALINQEALDYFKDGALNPEHPILRNTVQNGDVYFQIREASNPFYDALPEIVEEYLQEINQLLGKDYHLFNYYGDPEATDVIVAMGSVSGTICEAVDYLNAQGRKTGFLQVHLYRPFADDAFKAALPESVKRICVLDRCKCMGRGGEPLFQDVCTVFSGTSMLIIGGRYGLSSKDTDPAQIVAAFDHLASNQPFTGFTIGIEDDLTHLSLKVPALTDIGDKDTVTCKFWGLGGDGTVGANHHTVQILGDYGDYYAQAYFEYDAKKSFGTTKSHLKFSKKPIRGSYYVKQADFAACHNQSYIGEYDIVSEVKPGGTFLLNCSWSPDELDEKLPADVKRCIAERKIRFFTIDATAIAGELGLGSHTNTVLQAAFFTLTSIMPEDDALEQMAISIKKAYFSKGEMVVQKNLAAIEAGKKGVQAIHVPESWLQAEDEKDDLEKNLPFVVREILYPINRQKGDQLPVGTFVGREDGNIEMGLTAYEKRGIASILPQWEATKCLQCNLCSLVCPHAAIRPYLLDENEQKAAPKAFEFLPAKGKGAENFAYTLQVSTYDCTGCGSCTSVCPSKEKALNMVPAVLEESQKALWQYGLELSDKGDIFDPYTVKGSQFRRPLMEFSAACAGCGETPYAKLMTQLFGDRVYWANGTGCSQAWGAPMPGIPYTVNQRGFGPAWTNSLFENNAELMLGMYLSVKQQREGVRMQILKMVEDCDDFDLIVVCQKWLNAYDDFDASRQASDELILLLEAMPAHHPQSDIAQKILRRKDQLAKKTFWMYGGDGWAYDIGFGGLDHVIAQGENINVFVIDTEVYSNTGGQSSKATPVGAVAQFAASGKKTKKKELGAIMMSYENVYVAQVAMGANPAQLIRVLHEAEEYPGPSLVVAYTPCIEHGIKLGMSHTQEEMKRAVASGYWNLYHYDPRCNPPMKVDSKEPSMSFEDFLDGENRYALLKKTFPENAETLFAFASEHAAERYHYYKNLEK